MKEPLTVSAHDLGTPEAAWLACPRLAACPGFDGSALRRVVVLAPHPDDEVLAVGGTMRLLTRAGASVLLVAITDGEASHPRSPTVSRQQLADLRAAERRRALFALGLANLEVVRLGIRDGGVATAVELAARIATLLRGADACMAPWECDGHPDHDATGRAALCACEGRVRLVRYPVWAWHWARPSSEDLPWPQARRVELDAQTVAAKRAAIAEYRSQRLPLSSAEGDAAILPLAVLARFERAFELVFV